MILRLSNLGMFPIIVHRIYLASLREVRYDFSYFTKNFSIMEQSVPLMEGTYTILTPS